MYNYVSQAAKEDKIPSLEEKKIIEHNDHLVNEGMVVVAEKTEAIKDKTAFSNESKVKSESILAKEEKSLVKDDRSLFKEDKSFMKDDKSFTKDDKSLVKDDKSLVKSQESKAPSDKTPPLGRQQDKSRGGAVAKTGRIASMFEKASSPCPGGAVFFLQPITFLSQLQTSAVKVAARQRHRKQRDHPAEDQLPSQRKVPKRRQRLLLPPWPRLRCHMVPPGAT